MTPTGITKIVITNTRMVVPTIIGSTPVVSGVEEILFRDRGDEPPGKPAPAVDQRC